MHALLKNLFFLCLGKQLYYEALTSQIFQKMRREKDIGINHVTRGNYGPQSPSIMLMNVNQTALWQSYFGVLPLCFRLHRGV